jgi:hypothetical protein
VPEHTEVVVERAFCPYGPYLCDRYDRVILPTCETRHDGPGCRAGRRPVDHFADHRGKDALAWAGQREGGGVGHYCARGRWDLRIDHAYEHLIGGARRNLGGHRREMMHSQRARRHLGEHNLVAQRGVQRDTFLLRLPRSGATPQCSMSVVISEGDRPRCV